MRSPGRLAKSLEMTLEKGLPSVERGLQVGREAFPCPSGLSWLVVGFSRLQAHAPPHPRLPICTPSVYACLRGQVE